MSGCQSRRNLLKNSSKAALLAVAAANASGGAAGEVASGDSPREADFDKKQLVTYCGLYCGLCDKHTTIPRHAAALIESMKKGEQKAPDEVWNALKEMAEPPSDMCCRSGKCGAPWCAVRKCVKEKGLTVCPECDEYPCERIKLFGESEPLLLADGKRIIKYGLDKWIEEQEERRADGFCYASVRCYPYHYPDE